jgi:serine/threonine protein phosphatase PrpC
MSEPHASPEDAVLFLERNMEVVEMHEFCGGKAAVFSLRSPAKDTPNEDAAALIPFDAESGLMMVADGLGGSRGGAQASAMTAYELVAALETSARDGGILREAVLDGIESANREITTLAIGSASTVAVAEIHGNHLRPYHVGDSQILLLGQKGKQKLLTVSHSPVGYAQHSGLLNEQQAMTHEDRHFVFNVVGTPDMTIEMGLDFELSPRDTLLIACDGLFDNLSINEIIETLRKGELEEATQALVTKCLRRMNHPTETKPSKPDDLTLIVYRLDAAEENGS